MTWVDPGQITARLRAIARRARLQSETPLTPLERRKAKLHNLGLKKRKARKSKAEAK